MYLADASIFFISLHASVLKVVLSVSTLPSRSILVQPVWLRFFYFSWASVKGARVIIKMWKGESRGRDIDSFRDREAS